MVNKPNYFSKSATKALFVIAFGSLMFYFYKQFPSLNSKNDLIQVKGILKDFSFKENNIGRTHEYLYYFHLSDLNASFRIEDESVSVFKLNSFYSKVKTGDEISLYVLKSDSSKLNLKGDIYVFGANGNKIEFLDIEDAIAETKTAKLFLMYLALLSFVGGFIAYIYFILR